MNIPEQPKPNTTELKDGSLPVAGVVVLSFLVLALLVCLASFAWAIVLIIAS